MNAPAPDSGRRRFLTAFFSEPAAAASNTELRPIDNLPIATDGVLWAMSTTGAHEFLVAGDDGVVLYFDGTNWQREEFPSPHNIHSLCTLGDLTYSVGWMGQICVRERGTWRAIQGGGKEPATVNQPLFDIEVAIDGTLWTVGDNGRVTQFKNGEWVEHHTGTSSNLRAVLPLANGHILASGLGGSLLQYDGTRWLSIETDSGCPIVSMTELPDGQVLAVGGEYVIDSNSFAGRIFLYKDGKCSAVKTDYCLPRLRRVRRQGSGLVIVGDGGQAFRWTSDGVSIVHTRVRYDLQDVISASDGSAIICGDHGALLQERALQEGETPTPTTSQQSNWQVISRGETNKTLRCLWVIDDNTLLAAGDSGTVVHIDGTALTLKDTPGKQRIHSLWGSSPRNIFAACDAATILHFDGSDWQVAHQGRTETALLAITGFGPHDIFAVGDNGLSLRYDGLMWHEIETGVKQELYGLWGQDSQHLLAVGGGGLVMRWNGERWKQFTAGTDYDLYGVTGSGLDKLFLCGLAGTLIRFEDNAWHKEFTGVRSDLHAVSGQDGSYYVVGSNGAVLKLSADSWDLETSGISNTLQAIAVTDSSVYAVGSGGVVLRRD